jgi:molecular chaperone DnaJ
VRAALGGEIQVHALDGSEVKLKIPEGTQSGRQLKAKGKGMPVLRGRDYGDLHVQISVETPQKLTKRQKELLAEFEEESSHDTHPEETGFFARMKDLFGG